MIEGKFPPYKQIVPVPDDTFSVIDCDVQSLIGVLKKVSLFGDVDKTSFFKMTLQPNNDCIGIESNNNNSI